MVRLEAAKCECAREAGREASWLPSQLTRGCGTRARRCCLSWHCSTTLNADRRGVWLGSVRLEESGEWSGGVPECRTAHAAHQQRVERGGRRPRRSRSLQGRQKNFRDQNLHPMRLRSSLQDPARAGGDPVLLPPLVWCVRFSLFILLRPVFFILFVFFSTQWVEGWGDISTRRIRLLIRNGK